MVEFNLFLIVAVVAVVVLALLQVQITILRKVVKGLLTKNMITSGDFVEGERGG